MKNPTTRRPRRCRCEQCDTLYHHQGSLYGICNRCLKLLLRLAPIYTRTHDEAFEKLRAILADPLGPEAREAMELEDFLKQWREADGYSRALIRQKIAEFSRAARRNRFEVIDGGRES